MAKLIECVPNFSEGRDAGVIRQITDEVERVLGVKLLHVDPGKSTNRTVVTFAGEPDAVVEAAFRAIRMAATVIDMRRHRGEHPRMGATDVCPLIPIAGISMAETAALATELARRVGSELGIPVYLYEHAQPNEARRNLAVIRSGEYEGFFKKIKEPGWAPDFGPREFNPIAGATVIGARDFLVAYNVNLNTTSTRRANAIAFDVREAGRPKRHGNPLTGSVVSDDTGNPVSIPGTLKAVKAIGWFIEEYGQAQVSMNLTNLAVTPLHAAFDEVCRAAEARGVRVTGSELVGLVPLATLLDAGRHFLRKQQRSLGVSERELIHIAVTSLGLDELAPFHPAERIIEYRLRDSGLTRLVDRSVTGFVDEAASESPAPGGGSVSALLGALAAALGTMVANLSSHKRGWDDRWEEFSEWAVRGQALKDELLSLVDEDTAAFNRVLAAMGLPKGTEAEKAARARAKEEANQGAIEVPFRVMKATYSTFPLLAAMAAQGNPASASDAGVGALCARSALLGAWLNVRTNVASLEDRSAVSELLADGARMAAEVASLEAAVLATVEGKFGGP
ncbi:MAG: glutamate formimidoyltransferase [Gemmatimonadetes bacterium]|nr:glutamate formimidoyltransferase [Gemmatimonadota bacterium]